MRSATLRVFLLAGLLSLAACSVHKPDTELRQAIQEVQSWAASSDLVADRWQRRALPTAYTMDALDAAAETVRQQADTIASLEGVPPDRRDRARDVSREVVALCGSMQSAVGRGDGAAVARSRGRLETLREQLRELMRNGAAAQ